MTKTKFFIYLSLLGLIIFYVIKLKNDDIKYSLANEKKVNESYTESNLNNLIKAYSKAFFFENTKIEGNEFLLDTLSRVLTKPKLVFKFPEEACDVCIDKALIDLTSLRPKIDDSSVIIITSFSSKKNFEAFKRKLKSNYTFLNLNNKLLIYGEFKNIVAPLFFILNTDMKINNCYFYQKELVELNNNYFKEIEDKLSDVSVRNK
ncbi:hypothetical protein [Formosa sp. 4Alg 33]|uniref:hypothetical protein n=1 Tax=Formosa sp. 4Alg 33 TaxID=3382189 RepID=UPI003D9C0B8B